MLDHQPKINDQVGCGNCFYLTPKIGSKGPVDSPFVIVGESPGINEIVKGQPFVGPSGSVIHETLDRVGLQDLVQELKVEPYFTNAISCLPRQKDAESQRAACMRCQPRLLQDILSHPRKVILALGSSALCSLQNDWSLKITKERGKLIKSNLAEIGIIPAVHPAFLLRGGGNYKQFERDIKYAVNLMRKGNKAKLLPSGTSYEVFEVEEDVTAFIKTLKEMDYGTKIGCDIETTGFNFITDRILYLGLHFEDFRSICIPGHLITDELLAQEHLRYVWHNGKFDVRFLRAKGFPSARVDDDTMLESYTLNERRGIHDLDAVSSDWLGSVNHKGLVDQYYKGYVIDDSTGLKRRSNLSDAPPDLVERYLALDINDTYHIDTELLPQIYEDKNLTHFYDQHLIPGSEFLTKLELNGLVVAPDWVEDNDKRLRADMLQHMNEINTHAQEFLGHDINPNSWQQVKALYFGAMKLAPISTGTDKDSIEELYRVKPHAALRSLRNYRLAQKAHGTYVKPLMFGEMRERLVNLEPNGELKPKNKHTKKETQVYPDGRLHPSFLLHGTPTSRLACRDPNVQNFPRDPRIRGMVKAPDGYMILECDYSQAELRCLAALSRCAALMDIYLTGKDLHNEFTTFLFGPGWTKENKMAAKTVNFGIPYGREAPSIASNPDLNKNRAIGKEITIEEAQGWIDGWAARFPGAWEFIQICRAAPARNQTMLTCFGNKKRPGVVSAEKLRDLQNESANFPHQSTASNCTIRAGIELFDTLRDEWDTHIVNTVHDCLVMYVPKDKGTIIEVSNLVMAKMEEIPARYKMLNVIPFKAEAEIGHHWGNLVKLADVEKTYGWDFDKIPTYIAPH